MKKETLIWLIVFIAAGVFLLYRAVSQPTMFGTSYVRAVHVEPDPSNPALSWTTYEAAPPRDAGTAGVMPSLSRTVGIWVSAFLTLAIFSFLYRDNPVYKFAEALFVGVSAAYWMVVAFWTVVIPNLLGSLYPAWINSWAMPGLPEEHTSTWWWLYYIPLVLGFMLLWRLAPKGGWISRWPLAFVIGTISGLRLVQFIHADFLTQIGSGIVPLVDVTHTATGAVSIAGTFWGSVGNIIMVVGVLACLTYFFFSIEHKGVVGKVSRLGIWVLMITFGAMFGYTVMGRIALLGARLEFLFNDWLWLIDPTGDRTTSASAAVGMLWNSLAALL